MSNKPEIGNAVERGSNVYVYDERNSPLFSRPGELHGYTSNTVSILRENRIHTYDSRGTSLSVRHA